LDIEIAPNGQVKIHVKGVKGQACLEYARVFEEMLGKIIHLEHTSEYYEPSTNVGIHVEAKEEK